MKCILILLISFTLIVSLSFGLFISCVVFFLRKNKKEREKNGRHNHKAGGREKKNYLFKIV
jgi:MFS superfamily sulfate permease-like transporter